MVGKRPGQEGTGRVAPRLFSPEQRRTADRVLSLAEDLTGEFYRIPGREWDRFPHDLETLREGPGPTEHVFAEVVRLVADVRPGKGSREVYRIRVRDDAVLSAVTRGARGVEFFPLLLYVLTHEMVHVVRFGSGLARFEAAGSERALEEDRVHRLTREVLRCRPEPGLHRAVDAYRAAAAGLGPDPAVPPR